MWAGWARVGHPLYREDLFSLDICGRIAGEKLLVAVRPAVRRAHAGTFPASTSLDLSMSAMVRCTRALDIGFDATFTDRDSWKRSRFIAMASMNLGRFALVLNRISTDVQRREIRIGIEIELDRRLILVSGYRTGSDELSVGVLLRIRDFLVALSVSHHIVLGQTVSFSIGRVWVQ
jgi:hypothetical protein